MATKFKGVRGGTPTGEPLCRSCRYANYRQGRSVSSVTLICSMGIGEGSEELHEEIYECRSYSDARVPMLHEIEQTAWKAWRDLDGHVTFVNPAEFMMRERKRLKMGG